MALVFGALAALFGAYQAWLLPVLTDWVSSAVDEGYTSHAASRIRAGEWPYRDFHFVITTEKEGTLHVHYTRKVTDGRVLEGDFDLSPVPHILGK